MVSCQFRWRVSPGDVVEEWEEEEERRVGEAVGQWAVAAAEGSVPRHRSRACPFRVSETQWPPQNCTGKTTSSATHIPHRTVNNIFVNVDKVRENTGVADTKVSLKETNHHTRTQTIKCYAGRGHTNTCRTCTQLKIVYTKRACAHKKQYRSTCRHARCTQQEAKTTSCFSLNIF